MDRVRLPLILAVLLSSAPVLATPQDTAYDFLYAVETGNGEAFLETLTEGLAMQITTHLDELLPLVLADESIAVTVRLRFGLTQWDLENLSTEELLGRMLLSVSLYSEVDVVEEDVVMSGGEADVTLFWYNGGSISFGMVWEESSWRISESDLFSMLFR